MDTYELVPESEWKKIQKRNVFLERQVEKLARRVISLEGRLSKMGEVLREARSQPSPSKRKSAIALLKQERGEISESRVVSAVKELMDGNSNVRGFVMSARHATPEEDHAGIDVVVETNLGQITLQVKSSDHGALKAMEKKQKAGLGTTDFPVIVVVSVDMLRSLVSEHVERALMHGKEILKRKAREESAPEPDDENVKEEQHDAA